MVPWEMGKIPKFEDYTFAETKDVGEAFLKAFLERSTQLANANVTAQWTEIILDWFAETAPDEGVVVDAKPSNRSGRFKFSEVLAAIAEPSKRRSGECLVDLAHHRLPSYDEYHASDYWSRAYDKSQRPEMLLALESECGKRGNRPGNTPEVMQDASKLVVRAARVKVVVFARNDKSERERIKELAEGLRHHDYTRSRPVNDGEEGARPHWLWLDLPWGVWGRHKPAGWVATVGGECEDLGVSG